MFKIERVHYSSTWCKGMIALLKKVRKDQHLPSSSLFSQKPLQQCRSSGKYKIVKISRTKRENFFLVFSERCWCCIFFGETRLFLFLNSGFLWPEKNRNLLFYYYYFKTDLVTKTDNKTMGKGNSHSLPEPHYLQPQLCMQKREGRAVMPLESLIQFSDIKFRNEKGWISPCPTLL